MTARSFDIEDQRRFSQLSGDANPLHLDVVGARRMIFGRVVVHGVHLLLWALDQRLPQDQGPLELASLRADFSRPLPICELAVIGPGANDGPLAGRIEVTWEGRVCAVMDYRLRAVGASLLELPKTAGQEDACRELGAQEAKEARGELELYLDNDLASVLFPRLTALLPPSQLAMLLATTRLVGMRCPGLHSIFSALELEFGRDKTGPARLAFKADGFQPRFSQLWLAVEGPGFRGRLKTFLRPAPRQQTSYSRLAEMVTAGEFAGVRALVIGGSRGLGEVAGKLLAAGGASLRLTYRVGQEEARQVVDEIRAGGGDAGCLAYDILDPPDRLGASLGDAWRPNLMFYSATPPIFVARRMHFSPKLFDQFCDYYVKCFRAALQRVQEAAAGPLKVLYPSTEAIDQLPPDMGEYAAAKAAGETMCAFLEKVDPRLKIMCPRLPRLPTDQTASLLPVASHEPDLLLLEWLRRLHRA